MANWPRHAAIFALTFLFAALLGWRLAYWQSSKIIAQQDSDLRNARARLECLSYWSERSGKLDAAFEFQHGRRALIEVSGGWEGIEWELPGIRRGVSVKNVRRDLPVPGPDLDKFKTAPGDWQRIGCDDDFYYASDYNVRMLQLLGRSKDAVERGRVSRDITVASKR
jgi:hypothetical protein